MNLFQDQKHTLDKNSIINRSVLHGDCLELMRYIPNGSIDMILCDLPYGTTVCKWDIVIPFDKLWEQYERIIKPNGAIIFERASIQINTNGYDPTKE